MRIFVVVYLVLSIRVYSQTKTTKLLIYGGPTFGLYIHQQAPLDYRAWEFNNYLSVKEEMKAKKSFSGMNLGFAAPIHFGSPNHFGLLLGGEFIRTNNRMNGTRDSLGRILENKFNQRTTSFYLGFGFCSPQKKGKDIIKKFTYGYGFYMCRSFYRVINTFELDGEELLITDLNEKDRFLNFKQMILLNYSITNNFKLGLYPYYESHLVDFSVAPHMYSRKNSSINYIEHYNLKNFGVNICFVIGI